MIINGFMLAFAAYFVVLATIGFLFYKSHLKAASYHLGNRSVNYWVIAIATQASDASAWLFMGFPAAVFARGLPEVWTAIGLVFCMFLNWRFIAPYLRIDSARYQGHTIFSYIANKFNDGSGLIRFISAVSCLIFFTVYLSSGLVGIGDVFESSFGISYHAGIILGLVAAALYTLVGGFLAVAWCNFFQGMFLLIIIVIMPLYSIYAIGGLSTVIHAARIAPISLSLIPADGTLLSAIMLALSWGLGYFGQPHVLTNFMGMDDPQKFREAEKLGLSWQIVTLTSAALIGIIGLAYYPMGLVNNEMLYIVMTKAIFPSFIAGLFLCAILSATLSTMDNKILISGSIIAEDMVARYTSKKLSSKMSLFVSRLGAIAVSLLALWLAWNHPFDIYTLVNYAWSGLGATFGPVVIATLFWKQTTRQGIIAGLIAGALVSGLWPLFHSGVYPLVPGFIAGTLAIVTISLFTRK